VSRIPAAAGAPPRRRENRSMVRPERVLVAAQSVVPWANGGGVTCQVARDPPDGSLARGCRWQANQAWSATDEPCSAGALEPGQDRIELAPAPQRQRRLLAGRSASPAAKSPQPAMPPGSRGRPSGSGAPRPAPACSTSAPGACRSGPVGSHHRRGCARMAQSSGTMPEGQDPASGLRWIPWHKSNADWSYDCSCQRHRFCSTDPRTNP
jgi:hypothetical protein